MKKVEKLISFLDSVRGTDKTLMLVQYSSKLLIWYLKKIDEKSLLATRIANLAGPVSDFRILLRYYGLLPLLKYIKDSEANPDANPRLRLLARLQNLSMLLYYPLEHAYWLGLHQVIPMTEKSRDKIGMWSCRFWAAYVVLTFAQLFEERVVLKLKERSIKKQEKSDKMGKELVELEEKRNDWSWRFFTNACYFPLTVHWSLENSSFPDVGVGLCGTAAALSQLYVAFRDTK